jgi:glycosyltransferase involved in cell wall biosynthesis
MIESFNNETNEESSEQNRASSESENKSNPVKKTYYNRNRKSYRRYYHNKKNYRSQEKKNKYSFEKISIVVPLFNEEESIPPLFDELKKTVTELGLYFEVIFVDDGSTDNSLNELKKISQKDRRFKYISFRKNYGKSAALQVGFNNAIGDVIVTMDADLQDDPSEVPNLLNKIEEGYDLVSGWKRKRYDPFIKRISSKFFNYVTGVLSGIKIHDFNCGLKAYRKEVVKNIKVYGELHRYMPVLADWQGFRISEIPVKHHPRRYGKTKFGISRFFKGFIDLITVIFTTRYIKRPMHLFGFFGALSFIAGIIVNGYLTILWLSGGYLSNRPMLFLGILLIIVGVQFFSTGLLGEMMVNNFSSEKEYDIKDKG